MITSILSEAWRIFCERFAVIAAVVVVVWLPCELLSSYFDAFVFGPDDFRKSFRFAQLLENCIGIIATAGVTFIALSARSGKQVTFGSAIGAGFSAWGRMWWTRFLSGIALLGAFLLLIIPGVYVLTRLCFVESIVVAEGISGSQAMRRSFEITKGRFWPTFGLGLILLLVLIVPIIVVVTPTVFIPALDYWLIDAASQLVCDVIAAFITVALLCGYQVYSNEPQNA
jgi:hypothetical protein